mmetsp:Transcript_3267/g.4400  ORF Transcript_3267/g.4400 Transcript_3267/m.4400 type:complete len:143 (-) Transcript_3267:400-828(-)|eukprot:CAMPEP_0185598920 /NCGR_PEP_ID=MMETSP0434-20130131/82328_1 /TAXON_ID=626734 ORGANISM="Favella taraikaensis, Strain Fe Narragansett Bay" /NCGR_SAMPLE_ID=MMETSP0434 /ASSEMBLY_ACC=CAM_ASM_000379 /LENGTH=142 /DNA_ID=CAMNT_0028228087 /DNA_START=1013 /DNA_END=1441 /DNA_ORIENTATION=+
MIEKQNQMHQFANCLEQLLVTLKESDLLDVCTYTSLVEITPIDDEFFKLTPGGRCFTLKSDDSIIMRRGQRQQNSLNELLISDSKMHYSNDRRRRDRPKVDLKGKLNEYIGAREISRKQQEELKKLIQFIELVRSNNEQTLH